MRIAHLILAHKTPAQLDRLIEAMSYPAFDLYIHLDKKVDIRQFRYLAEKKNVFFIANRAKVYWAGYGTIQATINGFKEILQKGGYDYINVISAQDFPLKSPADICHYIANRRGTEFITCESIEDEWINAAPRVLKYHLVNWSFPGKYRLENIINFVTGPRKFPIKDYKLVGRSNWFTITEDAARHIITFLGNKPEVARYFKFCWGGDEFIFASILYNSPFREKIHNNLVYVDWTGQTQGHPRILLSSDLPVMLASGKLFARKVDMFVDNDVLLQLEELISPHPKNSGIDHAHNKPGNAGSGPTSHTAADPHRQCVSTYRPSQPAAAIPLPIPSK